jgi:hypothetical protein
MLDYENVSAAGDIRFERVGDVLTIKLPKEGFARGAGNLLRSRQFWILLVLLLLVVNFADLTTFAWRAFHGRVQWSMISAQQVVLLFFQPAMLVCVYAALVGQIATTIRLDPTELVNSVHSLGLSGREGHYARGKVIGVNSRWMALTITLDQPAVFKMGCRRVSLFFGRTRDERERVAAAIRNWIEQTPAELRR